MYRRISSGASAPLQTWTLEKLQLAADNIDNFVLDAVEYEYLGDHSLLAEQYDAVVFRGVKYRGREARSLASAFCLAGKKVFDRRFRDSDSDFRPMSKAYVAEVLLRNGIPHPATQAISDIHAVRYEGEDFVVKLSKGGRRGNGVYLVNSDQAIERMQTHMSENDLLGNVFVRQQYIPNTGDYRMVLVGGSAVAISKRGQKDPTRVCMDSSIGRSKCVSLSQVWLTHYAAEASRVLGLSFASADVCVSREGIPYVIEINECPSVKILSKRCKVNILRQYLRFIIMEVNNE